ncbi:MAG: hypothetical protein JJE39_00965 [Vicinamibacteria bacterium]|nr:hypothetical protein [Vicinamibacteria bacterium]
MRLTHRDVRMALALAALIVAANAGYVASKLGVVHRVRDVMETDHRHYIHMAMSPQEAEDPPYAFRVAVPTLARGLMAWGLSVNQAFYALTQISLGAFLACTFLFLRARGFTPEVSALVLVLMGLTQGAVRWFEYQYWMSDPLCMALVAAAILAIEVDTSWRLAIPIAFAGGFVRESFVLILPFAFFRTLARHDIKQALLRTVAIAAAFFSVSLSLHAVITPIAPDDWWSGIVDSMGFRYRRLFDSQWYVLTFGTWGVFVPLALAEIRAVARRLRDNLDLVTLTLATYATLIISNNTERPLAYAWLAVAAAGAAGLRSLTAVIRTPYRHPFHRVAAVCLGAQMVHFGLTRWNDLSGSSLYQPANFIVTGLMLALGLVWALVFARLKAT